MASREISKSRTRLGWASTKKPSEAVRSWRFTPALKDGKPVAVQIAVEVDFHLYGSPADGFVGLSEKARTGAAKAELDLANFYLQGIQAFPKAIS